MKIAICGSNDSERNNLVKQFISQWPMYATPAQTIFDDIAWPDNSEAALAELKDKLNEVEQILFAKMLLLEKQHEMYATKGYILYNGSCLDILVNSLILCENGYVTEDFVERVIYHSKKLLKKLDVVYYLPNNKINESSSDKDKQLESVYWNLYENYQTDFENSPFFDQKDCPSILLVESTNYINEIKMLIDKDGNLEGTSAGSSYDNLIDTDKLKKALRNNPQLLEAAIQSLKADSGQNTGTILL